MHHCAKFCAEWSNHCRDIAIFKIAAVCHLGFVILLYKWLDHPWRVFDGLCHYLHSLHSTSTEQLTQYCNKNVLLLHFCFTLTTIWKHVVSPDPLYFRQLPLLLFQLWRPENIPYSSVVQCNITQQQAVKTVNASANNYQQKLSFPKSKSQIEIDFVTSTPLEHNEWSSTWHQPLASLSQHTLLAPENDWWSLF